MFWQPAKWTASRNHNINDFSKFLSSNYSFHITNKYLIRLLEYNLQIFCGRIHHLAILLFIVRRLLSYKGPIQSRVRLFFGTVVFDSIFSSAVIRETRLNKPELRKGLSIFYVQDPFQYSLYALDLFSLFAEGTHLPDALIGFVVALMITRIALSYLMLICTTGMAIDVGGLILVFNSTPEPFAFLAGLLVFLAALQITATNLIILPINLPQRRSDLLNFSLSKILSPQKHQKGLVVRLSSNNPRSSCWMYWGTILR